MSPKNGIDSNYFFFLNTGLETTTISNWLSNIYKQISNMALRAIGVNPGGWWSTRRGKGSQAQVDACGGWEGCRLHVDVHAEN